MRKTLFLCFLFLLVISTLYLPLNHAQDYTEWELPEGAIARLGKGRINQLQYSLDGTLLFAATTIGVWIYDTETYKERALLTNKNRGVEKILFDPAGKTMVSKEDRYNSTFWDINSHIPQKKFSLNTSIFRKKIIFSPDGETFAVADYKNIKINEVASGKNKHILKANEQIVESLAFSPDSQILASGSIDQQIRLWQVDTGKLMKTFNGHTDTVDTLSFSPDSSTLVSISSKDNSIYFWDVPSGARKKVLAEKGLITEQFDVTEKLAKTHFTADDSMLVTVSINNKIRLWDTTTGTLKQSFNSEDKNIKPEDNFRKRDYILISLDNQTMANLDSGTVQLWDVVTGKRKGKIETSRIVHAWSFSPDSKTIVTGLIGGEIRFWDVATGKLKKTIKNQNIKYYLFDSSEDFPLSMNSQKVAYADIEGSLHLWDVTTKRQHTLTHKNSDTDHIHDNRKMFSSDGKILVSWKANRSANSEGILRIWDVKTGKLLRILRGPKKRIRNVCFSSDSATLASWCVDQESGIRLWDIATGRQEHVLNGHTQVVESVSFNPNDNALVSGGLDGSVRIWNAETGKEVKSLSSQHNANNRTTKSVAISCVRFNQNGNIVAAGNKNGVIHLWDVDSGKLVQTLKGHMDVISSLSFSPDGQTIASTSKDSTIRLWDVNTSEQIQSIAGYKETVWHLSFLANGLPLASGLQNINSGSYSESIDLWDLRTGSLLKTFTGDSKFVKGILFANDGNTLASLGSDSTVLLWDLASIIKDLDGKE